MGPTIDGLGTVMTRFRATIISHKSRETPSEAVVRISFHGHNREPSTENGEAASFHTGQEPK